MMKLNLLVIRTVDPLALKEQYEQLGFEFDYHRHGNGPFHYASENDGFVFEIYPLSVKTDVSDEAIRLGFDVKNLEVLLVELEKSNWKVISRVSHTPWGPTAIVQDLDGRKVELRNT